MSSDEEVQTVYERRELIEEIAELDLPVAVHAQQILANLDEHNE